MAELPQRFKAALQRLTREIDSLRTEQAAIAAYNEARPASNRFLVIAFIGMLGDRLIRLMRIFENSADVASFWYLHRCAPQRMKSLDVERLRAFSDKLKTVRNLTFVHLDKKGIFDSAKIWQDAGITDNEIVYSIETVRRVLYDLWVEEFGRAPIPITDNEDPRSYKPSLDGLIKLMKKGIAELSATDSSR